MTFRPKYTDLYERKPNLIKSCGVRILPITLQILILFFISTIPAWCINKPKIRFDLHSDKKSETSPIITKAYFNELTSNNTNYTHIYIDGSKDDMKVGCAVVSENYSEIMRIPDVSSIFTAEAKAIDLALDFIADCETSSKSIILSDSFRF